MKKVHILSICLVTILCLCTGCNDREAQQETYRQQGIAYMEQQEYENALKAFQNALDLSLGEISEEEIDICLYKAETLYHMGQIEAAADVYSAVIAFNGDAKAYYLRGTLNYSMGFEEKALDDFANAIKNDKENYDLYVAVHDALMANGKIQLAHSYLKQAMEIRGTSGYDKMQKGRIEFLLGDTETAVSLLKEAVAADVLLAHQYLGEIYLETQDYPNAITSLNEALKIENLPDRQNTLKCLIIAYERHNDFESAKRWLEEYIKAYPEDEEALKEQIFLETR